MNAAKDCTLQEKLLRCAMALILAAGALLASVAASPAYAAPSTVDVSIGGKIPYGGFATTWMSADGNIAYCAEPSSPTPEPGSYSTSPVPSGDVTAAIWYSFGSPGFDASMFPGSWYDGGGWDDAKYAAASHVLIAYAYSGSESAATHGTSSEFSSWAKSELIGGTFAKMKAGAGKVSAGFEAFCVRTGGTRSCRRPRRSRAAATRRRLASTPASTGSSSPSRTARRTRSSLTASGASRARPWPR